MIKLLTVAALVIFAFASPAEATTETNKAIGHVGSQDSGIAYVTFAVPPTGSCAYDNVYIDITTDKGKEIYAIALTAYAEGRSISRIDYTNTSGTCFINILEM